MVSEAYKNRNREEIIAVFRKSIRKKQEWIKQSDWMINNHVASFALGQRKLHI
jgi:hypothetical protein